MKSAPDQNAVESALALAADSHDTQTPACINSTLAEVVVQLERLVAATLRQTAMIQESSHQIAASIIAGQPGVNFHRDAVEDAHGIAEEIRCLKRRIGRG